MPEQEQYNNTTYPPIPPPIPIWRRPVFYFAAVAFLLVGFVIRGCTGPHVKVEVPVTRIVPVTAITEVLVVTTTKEEVEVTRLVPEIVVTEIPITRIVTETAKIEVEVTRIVPEAVVTEVPVTRIVREVEEIVVTRIVPVPPEITITPGSGRACTRFNLEVGRNKVAGTPEDGIYMMQELSGHRIATWTAQKGWLDSGWLRNLPNSRDEVYVQVIFYPAMGGGPIQLEILNPAPGTSYGWLANDICHAVEIQFPE